MNVSSPPVRHRHSVSEFQRMAQAGILAEDDRLELIDGDLIGMTPIGSRHAGAVSRLTRLFGAAVGADAIVSVQNPVQLVRYSQPSHSGSDWPNDGSTIHPGCHRFLSNLELTPVLFRCTLGYSDGE